MRRIKAFIFSTLLLLFLLPDCLAATTYYVSKSGSDANSCATAQTGGANAKLTIDAGIGCLAGGDTLTIEVGTYTERIDTTDIRNIPNGSGSFASATIIQAKSGDTVILQPSTNQDLIQIDNNNSYIIFKDFIVDGTDQAVCAPFPAISKAGIKIRTSDHIRLDGIEVRNACNSGILGGGDFNEFIDVISHDNGIDHFDHGIYMGGTNSNMLLDGGSYYSNAGFGIHQFNGAGGNNDNTIRNALVYSNCTGVGGCSGILIGSGSNNVAYNNVVRDHPAGTAGITCGFGGVSGNAIYNNTVQGNGRGIRILSNCNGGTVKNNIAWDNTTYDYDDADSDTTASNNLFGTDPLFTDEAGDDFTLTVDSPARNQGADLSGTFTDDFVGTVRPQGTGFEIGAFESSEAVPSPPTNLRILVDN